MIEIKRKVKEAEESIAYTTSYNSSIVNEKEYEDGNKMQDAVKKNLKPFMAIDGSNYRTVYRAVCNFHERNNPPRLGDDNGTKYWEVVADDMMAIANQFDNNPFVVAMLTAVFEELERQFKELPATRDPR